MGKNASKHVRPQTCDQSADEECFLVNAHLNRALEEQIWKKTTKTGYNLANYNMNQSLSELSIRLEDKPDNTDVKDTNKDNNTPLKVELPPMKTDNSGSSKVFLFDQEEGKEKGEKEQESQLNIEEFECGVHFGGGENSKQEWSFTLYDFDGHGKITKEDLVGLLKALYDAVGSSIKIPNNGTKTLKLRLSVGQDAAGGTTNVRQVTSLGNDAADDKSKAKDASKKKDNCKNKENIKQKDSPKSKVKEFSRLNNLVTSKNMPAKCNNETQAQSMATSVAVPTSVAKSRLTTQKHKELADLVKQNMERNHVNKPALRRHHSDCQGCYKEHPHYKRRHRGIRTTNAAKDNSVNNPASTNNPSASAADTTKNNDLADDTPKESQDRRNYYLDLAGVENTSTQFQNLDSTTALNSEQRGKDNSTLHTSKFQPIKSTSAFNPRQFCAPRHFRSRSHEFSEKKCDLVQRDSDLLCEKQTEGNSNLKSDHLRSRSFDPQEKSSPVNLRVPKASPMSPPNPPTTSTPQKTRFRPVSLPPQIPEAVSPHYHRRHRHREKNHDKAMQQVAEWIEREHTLDIEGDRIVIQRHEHHHVHEHHHHHHYHHYYEA